MNKWRKEYAISQGKVLQEHKLLWQNYIYSNLEALEQILQQSSAHKKNNKELKIKLLLMCDLVQKLLAARKPSLNYSLFLTELSFPYRMPCILSYKRNQRWKTP